MGLSKKNKNNIQKYEDLSIQNVIKTFDDETIVKEKIENKDNTPESKIKPKPNTPLFDHNMDQNHLLPEKLNAPVKLPDIDIVERLFSTGDDKLSSIVETITYKAKVPWLQGRQAWLADFASHYHTSRHFIARSLNGSKDYLTQTIKEGDKFNVLKNDINLQFYLVVDLSTCSMYFYAINGSLNQKILLKVYKVGLGRPDRSRASGCLTPLGKYSLGNKVVTYKPQSMGLYQGQSQEMIRIFGTRWIPFEKEISGCSDKAKGYGIHGAPWCESEDHVLKENSEGIGQYLSDGCIRLTTNDIEELFAIIITKPTIVDIVKDFSDAIIPGNELK